MKKRQTKSHEKRSPNRHSIGYHYTSFDCWRRIQVEGMQPYLIRRQTLHQYLGTCEVNGIWVWREAMTGLSHRGSILYQMGSKGALIVVLLKLAYDWNDLLHAPGEPSQTIELLHTGTIGNLEYHTGEEQAVIVTQPIPPSQIRLLATYSLLDVWKEPEIDKAAEIKIAAIH